MKFKFSTQKKLAFIHTCKTLRRQSAHSHTTEMKPSRLPDKTKESTVLGRLNQPAEECHHICQVRTKVSTPWSSNSWKLLPTSCIFVQHFFINKLLIEWYPCRDLRSLNLKTVSDSYVISNLHSLNFQLKGKHVFLRFLLVKCYYQLPVSKASCERK